MLARWGVEADDCAGRPLSQTAAGHVAAGDAAAAAEDLAPVQLLALLKHPLVGGEGDERLGWLDAVRAARPGAARAAAGARIAGARYAFRKSTGVAAASGRRSRRSTGCWRVAALARSPNGWRVRREALAGEAAWRGAGGRVAAELLADLQGVAGAARLTVPAEEAVPLLAPIARRARVRPPYGGHPRIFIWGLLEARLQQADLVILGGLNEGVWPGLPAPDPWLPPKIRADLGMPTLESRIGLSAHDFASALGAPEVLITRARREADRRRSPRGSCSGSTP